MHLLLICFLVVGAYLLWGYKSARDFLSFLNSPIATQKVDKKTMEILNDELFFMESDRALHTNRMIMLMLICPILDLKNLLTPLFITKYEKTD